MGIRCVAQAVDHLPFFRERCLFRQIVAQARKFGRVSVQIGRALRYLRAFRVIPGPLTDAVARVDGRLIARSLRAEIRVPGLIAAPGRCGKHLAVRVRSRQSTQIRAFTTARAGDEKAHGLLWLLCAGVLRGRILRQRQVRTQKCSQRK